MARMAPEPVEQRRTSRRIEIMTVDLEFGARFVSGVTLNVSVTGLLVYVPRQSCIPDRDVIIRFGDGTARRASLRWRRETDIGMALII